MIEEYRETLEKVPLSLSDPVSRLAVHAFKVPSIIRSNAFLFVYLVISEYLGDFNYICVFKVELHRICVCVRKRPLNKKGRLFLKTLLSKSR